MARFLLAQLNRRLHAADDNNAGGGADPSLIFAGADLDPEDEADFADLDRGDMIDDDPGEDHIPMPKGDQTPPADDKTPPADDQTPPADDQTPPADDQTPPAADPAPQEHDDGHRVPKYRLDSEIRKRREAESAKTELERRLEQLQGQTAQQQRPPQDPAQPPQQQTPPADNGQKSFLDTLNEEVADLDRQLNEAILDNEMDKAAELRRQLRAKEFDAYQEQFRATSQQTTEQVTERDRIQNELNAEAEKLLKEYPMLDTEHEKHSPEMVEEIVMLRDVYMKRGDNPALALRRATAMVARDNGFEPQTVETPPAPQQPPVQNNQASQQQAANRKAEAASRQPPKTGGHSNAEREVAIGELPEDQFDNLTEAQLEAARGDFIA